MTTDQRLVKISRILLQAIGVVAVNLPDGAQKSQMARLMSSIEDEINCIEYVKPVAPETRCCGCCDGINDICVTDQVCEDHKETGCEVCWPRMPGEKSYAEHEASKLNTNTTHLLSDIDNLSEGFKNKSEKEREDSPAYINTEEKIIPENVMKGNSNILTDLDPVEAFINESPKLSIKDNCIECKKSFIEKEVERKKPDSNWCVRCWDNDLPF